MQSKLSGAGWPVVLAIAIAAAANVSASNDPRPGSEPREEPSSATVPFTLDHNRMTVEVAFVRPDGTLRKARAWVDTGNQSLNLAEPLARDLGLDTSVLAAGGSQHSVESPSPAPRMRLGGLALDTTGVPVRIHPGALVRPGVQAEANLPASALRTSHVVFDYPAGRLTVARPGSLEPRGIPVPCRVNAETGLFLVSASLDGETVAVGIDNGSAGTWVSDHLTSVWHSRHPEWPVTIGAVGSANFFGFDFETAGTLMRLPEMGLGAVTLGDVILLGLDQRMFDWYSRKSAGTVAGFIGANVLKRFRLEVDWPNRMTYWEAGPASGDHDLDIVGLTLRPEPDGGYTVAGVAARGGRATVDAVEVGDRLVRVGPLDATGAPMGAVEDALRGAPGETRTLVLDREGRTVTVEAMVTRFP